MCKKFQFDWFTILQYTDNNFNSGLAWIQWKIHACHWMLNLLGNNLVAQEYIFMDHPVFDFFFITTKQGACRFSSRNLQLKKTWNDVTMFFMDHLQSWAWRIFIFFSETRFADLKVHSEYWYSDGQSWPNNHKWGFNHENRTMLECIYMYIDVGEEEFGC